MDLRGANWPSANHFKATWMYTDMDMVNIPMVNIDMVHMSELENVTDMKDISV